MKLISKFKVDRHGNTHIANWLGQDTCQQKTHVVEHRFVPGIMFMQAELWYTTLKVLNEDIYVFFQERIRPCFNAIHWPRLRNRFYMCDGCSSILHYKLLIENINLQYVCPDTCIMGIPLCPAGVVRDQPSTILCPAVFTRIKKIHVQWYIH